jgi:hypothetical protein
MMIQNQSVDYPDWPMNNELGRWRINDGLKMGAGKD